MNHDHTTILNVGFDDTDSPVGMCTTYLAYVIAGLIYDNKNNNSPESDSRPSTLRKKRRDDNIAFLDYPRLVRFNPNIPWKTRGNGAVSMRVRTGSPHSTKKMITDTVFDHADTAHGANPGLAFYEGDDIPAEISEFSRLALWQLVGRGDAKKFAKRHDIECHYRGNGQGLVGAIGAIGYEWDDHTLELLSYRKPHMRGTPRVISGQSVRHMQDATAPQTFNSYDTSKGRVLIAPRGPDPVFYGIRGENAESLVSASHMIRSPESPEGYMIFRTNQGTGAHLRNELDSETATPYASGWMSGAVANFPDTGRGGHVFFELESNMQKKDTPRVKCAVYKPTAMTGVARGLVPGDVIRVGGGVRRALRNKPRILNVEYIEVLSLQRDTYLANPECSTCSKKMKSKGVGQGFECVRCKGVCAGSKSVYERPRSIRKGLYVPAVAAQRHLTRPLQRLGVRNASLAFDDGLEWLHTESYDNSGE